MKVNNKVIVGEKLEERTNRNIYNQPKILYVKNCAKSERKTGRKEYNNEINNEDAVEKLDEKNKI
jgi:hypothetical protein